MNTQEPIVPSSTQAEIAATINNLAAKGWIKLVVPVHLSADVRERVALYGHFPKMSDDPLENLGGAVRQLIQGSSEKGFIAENVFQVDVRIG